MEKTVEFKNAEAASRVAQHLYHVVQDSEKLIFSEFDEIAFKAAVAWEGLTRDAYRYVSDNPIPIPPAYTGIRFRAFGTPRILLNFTLEAPERHYHTLSLNVLPDSFVMLLGCTELSLAIAPPLTYLIRILESTIDHKSVAQMRAFARIIANLERACMQIRYQPYSHNESSCGNLILHGAGQSCEVSLNLFNVSIDMNRSIFE